MHALLDLTTILSNLGDRRRFLDCINIRYDPRHAKIGFMLYAPMAAPNKHVKARSLLRSYSVRYSHAMVLGLIRFRRLVWRYPDRICIRTIL